jgi:3-oxoacyl-[acyl-carrier protein] reductase
MESLNGKIALVTGGSKGIGLGIARALIEQGVKVAVTSRSQASADAAVSMLGKEMALGIAADVRDEVSQRKAVDLIITRWGRLDVMIANAGLGHFGPIDSLTSEQWNETIETNLTGVFLSVKASLSEIKKTKGYIITIASLAGTNFFAGGTAYNASKFGLVGFTQALMLDVRNDGVKVSTIMPGSVATEFGTGSSNKSDSWKIQPEDIGQITVDLLKMNPRTLPSKIEVRPSVAGK